MFGDYIVSAERRREGSIGAASSQTNSFHTSVRVRAENIKLRELREIQMVPIDLRSGDLR